MNQTLIKDAPLELGQWEEQKVWRSGCKNALPTNFYSSACAVFTSEEAAVADAQRAMRDYPGYFTPTEPKQCTVNEANAIARANGKHHIKLLNETGTVIDWWYV